jgi:hypothetical protein
MLNVSLALANSQFYPDARPDPRFAYSRPARQLLRLPISPAARIAKVPRMIGFRSKSPRRDM